MHLVCGGEHVPGASELQRAQREEAARWLVWDGRHVRHFSPQAELWRIIPPPVDRPQIISNAQASLGFPGGSRLYKLLRNTFYWQGMHTDCIKVCAEALPV